MPGLSFSKRRYKFAFIFGVFQMQNIEYIMASTINLINFNFCADWKLRQRACLWCAVIFHFKFYHLLGSKTRCSDNKLDVLPVLVQMLKQASPVGGTMLIIIFLSKTYLSNFGVSTVILADGGFANTSALIWMNALWPCATWPDLPLSALCVVAGIANQGARCSGGATS